MRCFYGLLARQFRLEGFASAEEGFASGAEAISISLGREKGRAENALGARSVVDMRVLLWVRVTLIIGTTVQAGDTALKRS